MRRADGGHVPIPEKKVAIDEMRRVASCDYRIEVLLFFLRNIFQGAQPGRFRSSR